MGWMNKMSNFRFLCIVFSKSRFHPPFMAPQMMNKRWISKDLCIVVGKRYLKRMHKDAGEVILCINLVFCYKNALPKELGFMPDSFLYAKESTKKYPLHTYPTSIIIIDV